MAKGKAPAKEKEPGQEGERKGKTRRRKRKHAKETTDASITGNADGRVELPQRRTFRVGDLPVGLLRLIFSFLPRNRDRFVAMRVSKRWYVAASHPSVWQFLCPFPPNTTDSTLFALSGQSYLCGVDALVLNGAAVSGKGLNAVASVFNNLRVLDLSKCSFVSDSGVKALVKVNPSLLRIDLSHCRLLTDGCVRTVADSCRNLRELKLARCVRLSHKALLYVGHVCRKLEHLDIAWVRRSSHEGKPAGVGLARQVTEQCRSGACGKEWNAEMAERSRL